MSTKRLLSASISRRVADKQLTEIGGYATRLFSHYRPFNLAAFIASFSMIVMVSRFSVSVSALASSFIPSQRVDKR
jgi:hypothetical protein